MGKPGNTFHRSSASMYYTERKPNSEKWGRSGNEAKPQYVCFFEWSGPQKKKPHMHFLCMCVNAIEVWENSSRSEITSEAIVGQSCHQEVTEGW